MLKYNQIIEGEIILIDKPYTYSSFDVVRRIKSKFHRLNKTKLKIGHAGTLDPLATGLLVICTGKKTKVIESFLNDDKAYSGIIQIGATTPSFDLETEIDQTFDTSHITPEMIEQTAASFLGQIEQYPPIFSAVKIDGKRAYEMARKGRNVEVRPRQVEIKEFRITKIEGNDFHFYITCSKGTYIRSIAYDFGKKLNNGAHLKALRREKSGNFDVKDAYQLEDFLQLIEESFNQMQLS